MPDAAMLVVALLFCICGLAWLALAMEPHWRQVRGDGDAPAGRHIVVALRALGAGSLFVSLLICLRVDHASMASLVWVMALAAAALVVAFILTWRPRWLSFLVAWHRNPSY